MREFGGTWSEAKLDCVEEYVRAYLNVMQNQHWYRLDYVDAFAGRGRQALRSGVVGSELDAFFGDESERADTKEFLIGSAVRALLASTGAARGFERFVFIDADKPSCIELRALVDQNFQPVRDMVKVVCDDAGTALQDYVDSVDWKRTRAVVFLDPFGLEVRWNMIERLAATRACDVWYLFPLGGAIRMMRNDGRIPDSLSARLDELFGTHDWYGEFYKPDPQQALFSESDEALLKDASTEHIVEYVRQRLSTVFAAVSDAAVLRNSKGFPLFALVLGVSNPSSAAQERALAIANHIVKGLNE